MGEEVEVDRVNMSLECPCTVDPEHAGMSAKVGGRMTNMPVLRCACKPQGATTGSPEDGMEASPANAKLLSSAAVLPWACLPQPVQALDARALQHGVGVSACGRRHFLFSS